MYRKVAFSWRVAVTAKIHLNSLKCVTSLELLPFLAQPIAISFEDVA